MATCGEDEFGNLYSEVCREELGALRGFGSLYWSCEDDSDSSPDRKGRPECASEDCHTAATKKHYHQCTDGVEEEGKATFIPSGTCKGVPPAQGTSKQAHLTEISNSKHGLRVARVAEDMGTDSDDDLHIVLNPLEGVANEGINEDSDDGEDFVILTGSETMNDREWQESSCTPLEEKAQSLLEGGEKLGTVGDEKGQNGKSPRVQARIGYGSQVYHRHYQYVRGSGPSSVGANVSGRVNGKSDRFSGWRGFSNCQRVSLPTRRPSTARGGLSCGLEYSIPSNKTVFDVDMDALQEKPWRLSHVDSSDYFNFGFDEASWKNYCKQLAQFCLEITTQSKISVYEGGRGGQSTTSASQGGRGCEPWSSVDTEGLQDRESDAIFLIDAKADQLSQSCKERHSADSGEVANFLQDGGSPKSDVPLGSERGMCETAQPTKGIANQTCVTRLGAEHKKYGAGSGNETQLDCSVAICPEDGSVTPSALRPKILSPSTPPERIPIQDKRETQRGKSQSSSLNDGSQLANEDYLSGAFHSNKVVGRKEAFKLSNHVKACGRRRVNAALTFCEGNCGKLGTKRCSSPAITAPLYKKQRLGSQKENHGAHHSTQVAKKLSRPLTAAAVLGAYKAYAKAKITQHKKHSSINNAIECLNCDKSVDQYVDKSTEQPVFEKAERKANPISSKAEIKISKGYAETDSNKMNGQLQVIHSESAEEKSKEELKAKKSRKVRKCKEMIKPKECPNFEKGQVEGFDKTLLIKKQGAEKISMISFVSKGNCFYWKKVENMSQCNYQDKELKKLKSCKRHEFEQKTEAENKIHKRNDCPLGHFETGGDKEIKNEVLKLDGNTRLEAATSQKASQVLTSKKMPVKHMVTGEYGVAPTSTEAVANLTFETHASDSMQVAFQTGGDKEIQNEVLKLDGNTRLEAATSWKASQVLKSKKMRVKHMVTGEYGVAPTGTEAVANLIFETHASDSMQVAFNKQVSTRQQQKYSESKERQAICKRSHLEAEDKAKGHTDVAVPCEQSCKKFRSKKRSKSSFRNSDQPIIACSSKQRHGNGTLNVALMKDMEPMNGKNGAISPIIRGRIVNNSDFNDKDRKADSEICQSEIHSPKACGNILPNFSADTLNGKNYVGFGMTSKSPILSSGILSGKNEVGFDISRLQENHSPAEDLFIEQETIHATLNESSEEEVKQRGRSKFERWTTHSEQVANDSKVGRISLSRKVQASKFGHSVKHLDESAPKCTKRGDDGAVQSGARKEWAFARKQKGNVRRAFKETGNLSIRQSEQQNAQQHHLDHFVATLEKRRQRFKLPPMEETALLRSPALKDERDSLQQRSSSMKVVPFSEGFAVKLERPARKRCWGRG